ncbi:MAG: RNA polymerase sigma factor [Planctomycetes bacterium]|nr:RNA polymerase sigma factor [Planctomycetota bacterium]
MTDRDDLQLATMALHGDVTAFERLYRRHGAMVHALARRLCGSVTADDLTQDVFVRAWQKLATFRGEAPFRAWLRTLAVRWFANQWRLPELPTTTAAEPFTHDAPPGLRLDLEAAIGRLPAGARAVFVLHDVEGMDHAEVATLLGVSVGTSKSQLHRARALLRQDLGDPES